MTTYFVTISFDDKTNFSEKRLSFIVDVENPCKETIEAAISKEVAKEAHAYLGIKTYGYVNISKL